MRLSHKRKLAHKKGTYSLLSKKVCQIKKRIAKQLAAAHNPVVSEADSPVGEVGVIDRAVNAMKRLAGRFRLRAA